MAGSKRYALSLASALIVASAVLIAVELSGGRSQRAEPGRQGAPLTVAQSSLDAVSCAPDGTCAAVGQRTSGFELTPVAYRLSGGSWTEVASTDRAQWAELAAVSCASARFCMAVGAQATGGPLSAVLRASGWSTVPVKVPSGPPPLDGVSCLTPSFCIAVGATKLEHSLIESWDGRSWQRMASPDSAGTAVAPLRAVSCANTQACVAVGTLFTAGSQAPLIDELEGGTWVGLPLDGLDTPVLASVSCVEGAAVWCVAVGSRGSGATRRPALALLIDGSSVTAISPTATATGAFSGVSCTRDYQVRRAIGAANATAAPFAQRLGLHGWHALAPGPRGSSVTFGGVSCVEHSACAVVGGSLDPPEGQIDPLARRLSHGRWSGMHGLPSS